MSAPRILFAVLLGTLAAPVAVHAVPAAVPLPPLLMPAQYYYPQPPVYDDGDDMLTPRELGAIARQAGFEPLARPRFARGYVSFPARDRYGQRVAVVMDPWDGRILDVRMVGRRPPPPRYEQARPERAPQARRPKAERPDAMSVTPVPETVKPGVPGSSKPPVSPSTPTPETVKPGAPGSSKPPVPPSTPTPETVKPGIPGSSKPPVPPSTPPAIPPPPFVAPDARPLTNSQGQPVAPQGSQLDGAPGTAANPRLIGPAPPYTRN